MARTAHSSSGAPSSSTSGERLRAHDLGAGSVIADRYRLERPVGTGGMATIWEATHLALKRSVAVKFIDIAGPNSAKVRERFLREARVAAAVRHRNVVDIADFGTTEDGCPFMVMELLVGEPLSARISAGTAMSVAETVRIMARVLSGLAAVHDAGIVHRDLKPENVFLVADADGMFPKVLDFGVSRAVDPLGELESVLPTMENAIVGTPQYMSPEQARGLRNLDHRSDLWSVGVMLFELLTGVLPFDSDAVGDVIIQIATAEPPPLVSLRPDLAGPLERVIEKAMRRRPEDRFQSAREMRASLLAAAAHTANALARASTERSDEMATLSELPPVEAKELLAAVGDAYEPGDSGVLDLTEFADDLDATPGSAPLVPPPKSASLDDEKLTARAFSDAPASREPARSPRRIVLAIGGALAVLGASAIAVVALSAGDEPAMRAVEMPRDPAAALAGSEVPPSVSVELRGVPEGATVTVDGAPQALPIALDRSDATHRIDVRDAQGGAWSTTHVATHDGAYDVALERAEEPIAAPSAQPARSRPAPRRSSSRPSSAPRTGVRAEGLLRDPGF